MGALYLGRILVLHILVIHDVVAAVLLELLRRGEVLQQQFPLAII